MQFTYIKHHWYVLFIFDYIYLLLISQYNIFVKIYGNRMIQGYKVRMIAIALSVTRSNEITIRYYENVTTIKSKICYEIWYVYAIIESA